MSTVLFWSALINLFLFPTLAESRLRGSTSGDCQRAAERISFAMRLSLTCHVLISIGTLRLMGFGGLNKRFAMFAFACIGAFLFGGVMIILGRKLSQKSLFSYGVMQLVCTVLIVAYFVLSAVRFCSMDFLSNQLFTMSAPMQDASRERKGFSECSCVHYFLSGFLFQDGPQPAQCE